MNNPEALKDRLIQHTIDILNLVKKLPKTIENQVFFEQIIRSSSSIGANYSEAIYAHSRIEFIHTINISRKEASETIYWLEVIKRANPSYKNDVNVLLEESISLLKIFISSIKTAKSKIENKSHGK